jgi:hypothetical protein
MRLTKDFEVFFNSGSVLYPGSWTFARAENSPDIQDVSDHEVVVRSSIAQAGISISWVNYYSDIATNDNLIVINNGLNIIYIDRGNYRLARGRNLTGNPDTLIKADQAKSIAKAAFGEQVIVEGRYGAVYLPLIQRAVLPVNLKLSLRELEQTSGRDRAALHDLLHITDWIPWDTQYNKITEPGFILGATDKVSIPQHAYFKLSRINRYSDESLKNSKEIILRQLNSDIVDPLFDQEIITEHVVMSAGNSTALPAYARGIFFRKVD